MHIVKRRFVTHVYTACCTCYTVPSPIVVIETPGAVTYAGNNVTLNCATNLVGRVTDGDVTVNSRWTKDGVPFSGVSGRVTLTLATRISRIAYVTRLMFSPLSSSMDNGTYMCITTLTPQQPQFVTGNNANDSRTLTVEGEIYTQLIVFSMKCHLLPYLVDLLDQSVQLLSS